MQKNMRVFLIFCLLLAAASVSASSYTEEWQDSARSRTVPVRIFVPDEKQAAPYPVILLSHGLGGSREGFGYLGEYWSQHGYLVIVMQHHGSDSEIWTKRLPNKKPLEMLQEGVNAENARNRVGDVTFVLDELPKRIPKADLQHAAVGGHSFGSFTALAAVGRFPFTADKRLKAAIAMSPNTIKGVNQEALHRNIKVPVFHLTGTEDRSPIAADLKPEERRIPFDSIREAEQYLAVFQGGNHLLFSGHLRPLGLNRQELKYQPLIAAMTCLFLDAYLKEDADAKKRLQGGGLTELMKDNGTVEIYRGR